MRRKSPEEEGEEGREDQQQEAMFVHFVLLLLLSASVNRTRSTGGDNAYNNTGVVLVVSSDIQQRSMLSLTI